MVIKHLLVMLSLFWSRSSSMRPMLSTNEEESMKRLESICNVTLYSDQCYSTLSSVDSTDPLILFRVSLVESIDEHVKISGFPNYLLSSTVDESFKSGFKVCNELISDALEYLQETIQRFDEFGKALGEFEVNEMRGKLSFVIDDHETCLEGFEEIKEFDLFTYQRNFKLIQNLKDSMKKSMEIVTNSLAIVSRIISKDFKKSSHKRLLALQETNLGFPNWVNSGDRKFLLACDLTPNVTVAKDGTGDVITINDAVAKIPIKSSSRFVIHVKEGLYLENVFLPKSKYNVFMYGDGITKTIVSGSWNRCDNSSTLKTFQTATFSVEGKGFIVKDMKFVNTAGPEKHQAVAFRSKSDQSVMYRCAFEGFQDTLYSHAGVQFYRDCDIVGTVDFICGRAAAVFQNCTIRPRQPMTNQYDTVTAQSNICPDTVTGFSIINSKILPYDEANFTAVAYLGRPWKDYSTVVVMETLIEKLIDPAGWIKWNETLGPPTTTTYGEYKNYGPGSGVGKRVNWVGYKPNMTDKEAQKYTVNGMINQNGWLNESCVPYNGTF